MTTRRHFALAAFAATIVASVSAPALALNPQPLPPKVKLMNPGDRMLNPQPLPPRWKFMKRYLLR